MLIVHWEGLNTGGAATNELEYHPLAEELAKRFKRQLLRAGPSDRKGADPEQATWSYIKPNTTNGEGVPEDEFEGDLLDRLMKASPEDAAAMPQPSPPNEHNLYTFYQPVRREIVPVLPWRAAGRVRGLIWRARACRPWGRSAAATSP